MNKKCAKFNAEHVHTNYAHVHANNEGEHTKYGVNQEIKLNNLVCFKSLSVLSAHHIQSNYLIEPLNNSNTSSSHIEGISKSPQQLLTT